MIDENMAWYLNLSLFENQTKMFDVLNNKYNTIHFININSMEFYERHRT